MRIQGVTTLFFSLLISFTAFSQTSSSVTVDIEEVVISSGPKKLDQEESPRSISVIKAEEIIQSSAVSIGEVLETTQGIDYRQRGTIGIQADLSLRGGSFEQTALLLNGVRMSAPQTGHHLMDITYDPEDIHRIEVVRGGSSPFIGMGAFSGAVNIITGPSQSDGFFGTIEAGGYGFYRTKGRIDFGKTNIRHRISLSSSKTDGHIENTDATMMIGSYSSSLNTNNGLVKFEVSFADKKFGAQNFYTPVYPTQYEETETFRGQLSWEKSKENLDLFVAVHSRIHNDMFELFREGEGYYESTTDSLTQNVYLVMGNDTAASWYTAPNNHKSHTHGLTANALYTSKYGYTALRLDARNEAIYSNLLGTQEWAEAGLFSGDSILTNGDSRFNTEFALSHRVEKGGFSASLTTGLFNSSRFGAFFIPGFNTTLKLGKEKLSSYLFASANRSVRQPSFTDLYYSIGGAQGSQDLKSELSNNYEAGFRIIYQWNSGGKITLEESIFRRDGSNLIDWVTFDDDEEQTYQATNLREVSFQGFESSITLSDNKIRGSIGNSLQLSYCTINASELSSGFQSNYVLDYLKRKLDIKGLLLLPSFFNLSVRYSIQERINNPTTSILSSTLSRSFQDGKLNAHVRIDNALNAQIVDIGNVQLPGRWLRAGITLMLE
ncbi:MAG: hypothetical protein CL847_04830 [Crocinitomicaceae bacterium]|nr:hypothetical protein [Crocinitomicaceae bacterium]